MKRTLAVLLAFAVTAAAAQEITLSFKFKKGDAIRYKESIDQQMTAEGMPGGGQSVKNVRYTKLDVRTVNTDGSADVIRTTDSSSTLMNDKPFNNPQSSKLEAIAFKVTMDRKGKVLSAAPVSDPADDATKRMATGMAEQFKQNPGLPEKAVKVGDSWNDEINSTQDTPTGKLVLKVKTTTKLAKLEKKNGVELAVLDITGTLSGELGAGMGVITGTVKGTRWFDHKGGREFRSEMAMDQNMDIQTPQGNMVMQVKTLQTRELLK